MSGALRGPRIPGRKISEYGTWAAMAVLLSRDTASKPFEGKETAMNTWNRMVLLSASIVVCSYSGLSAHEHEMSPSKPASPEFNQVKQLAGKWSGSITHPGKDEKPTPIITEFKLTAAGSAIEETLMQGTPHEMVDMYTDENGKLSMTHYCAHGNQPHMLLKQAGPGSISLEMGPTTGINAAKDEHMHALALEFKDANHLTERWTSYTDGKPGEIVVFNLTRT